MKSQQRLIKKISRTAKLIAVVGLTFGLIPGAAAADPLTEGTLNVVTVVVNTHTGMDTETAFSLHVWSHGTEVVGSPMPGMSGTGRSYVLPVGTYLVSQTPAPGYRGMWSGPVTAGGTVIVAAGSNVTVTRTIYDVGLVVVPPAAIPAATPAPTPAATPTTEPVPTEDGGTLPTTALPFNNLALLGGLLILAGGIGFASRKVLVK